MFVVNCFFAVLVIFYQITKCHYQNHSTLLEAWPGNGVTPVYPDIKHLKKIIYTKSYELIRTYMFPTSSSQGVSTPWPYNLITAKFAICHIQLYQITSYITYQILCDMWHIAYSISDKAYITYNVSSAINRTWILE